MSALTEALSVLKEDDGSLPELRVPIELSTADQVYAYLKSRSSGFSHRKATYWSAALSQDVEIQWLASASELIRLAESQSFHVVLGGVRSETGNAVPDLGVFMSANELILDYRMGSQWSEHAVVGLFEILSSLSDIGGTKAFEHSVNQFDYEGTILVGAWESWRGAQSEKSVQPSLPADVPASAAPPLRPGRG